eukprot:scaffold305912_cov45-Prasinocladus_malaysianus.AAC.1
MSDSTTQASAFLKPMRHQPASLQEFRPVMASIGCSAGSGLTQPALATHAPDPDTSEAFTDSPDVQQSHPEPVSVVRSAEKVDAASHVTP